MRHSYLLLILLLSVSHFAARAEQPSTPTPQLTTRWTSQVDPNHVLAEHPRPQMVRGEWLNLNGLWDYAIQPSDQEQVQEFDGKILVPFAAESFLSGVGKTVGGENHLWYRRTFDVPAAAIMEKGERVLLHFDAADWKTTAWLNGQELGTHTGGYDPFTFDITDALQPDHPQELTVRVWDPTDDGFQPRGKQVKKPEGIWYSSVTGIWRTVWLEVVPAVFVERLALIPDIDQSQLAIQVDLGGKAEDAVVHAEAQDGGAVIAEHRGKPGEHAFVLKIPSPRLWSPDDPFLYDLKVEVSANGGQSQDVVTSYFGMRKISIGPDEHGMLRLCLNNKPLFQFGPLDQGWWPDGLYTAPTDEALRYDLEVTKQLGFNMIRKHVKVEPDRWYYHCDRLGLLVWQDMPNGDRHIGPNDPDIERSKESAGNYVQEWNAIIDAYESHPCIVTWVPFNEGWGQFSTNEILELTKKRDPTRLVDSPSGWTDRGTGDMNDVHRYPGPGMPKLESTRAAVLGEFGGLGLPLEGHLWFSDRNWGYRQYDTQEELQTNYIGLIRRLKPLIGRGLAAAVYTQTTDVEGEVNGLMTYDREVIKFDVKRLASLHRELYMPQQPLHLTAVVPTGEEQPQTWRYSTTKPDDSWTSADFDESAWQEGSSGFGEPSTPGTVVRTRWKTDDIWLRRTVDLDPETLNHLYLRIHHDEDAEVYLNGELIASLSGYQVEYIDMELEASARQLVRKGKNVIAVHCHQTGGGQYIDAGLMNAK